MENGHISLEQIEDLSLREEPHVQDAQGVWAHIERCEQCRSLVEKYQSIHAKFTELSSHRRSIGTSMKCPDENLWIDVAAGALPPAESLVHIQHAATCASCGRKLRAATRIFADELSAAEQETLDSLPSANPVRQRDLAESLGKVSQIQQEPGRPKANRTSRPAWFRLFLFATPAIACVIAILMVWNSFYTKRQLREVQEFVESEYSKGRPMNYRLAGMPYKRNRAELGSNDKMPTFEVPDAVKIKAPRLAAEAEFLKDDPRSAREILDLARRSGDRSAMTLNDLAVAFAQEAEGTHSEADYKKALEISEEAIRQQPDDATIYFNRALIFERLKQWGEMRKALEQVRKFDHDPEWRAEAEKILPSS